MPSELHLHLRVPHLSRLTKIIGTLVAVAALSGGIAIAAAPDSSTGDPSQPGSRRLAATGPITQTEYVPLSPCRIVDTRKAGGTIVGGHGRTFYTAGTTSFAPQGGTSGGCDVPAGATAVAVSVTTTRSAAAGYLTLYAHGSTKPAANQTSFIAGQTITTLVNAPVAPSDGRLDVFAATTTHVVIDVAGYYRAPIAATVLSAGTLYHHTSQVLSVTKNSTGNYTVKTASTVTDCAVQVTTYVSNSHATSYASGTSVYVFTTNNSNASTDTYFSVTVVC